MTRYENAGSIMIWWQWQAELLKHSKIDVALQYSTMPYCTIAIYSLLSMTFLRPLRHLRTSNGEHPMGPRMCQVSHLTATTSELHQGETQMDQTKLRADHLISLIWSVFMTVYGSYMICVHDCLWLFMMSGAKKKSRGAASASKREMTLEEWAKPEAQIPLKSTSKCSFPWLRSLDSDTIFYLSPNINSCNSWGPKLQRSRRRTPLSAPPSF